MADTTMVEAQWVNVNVYAPGSRTFVLPEEAEWVHLAATTMVLRRSDFNLDQTADRSCCTNPTDPDGTCGSPDYGVFSGPLRIYHDSNYGCGGSWMGGEPLLKLRSAPWCRKFVVAHEFGHVIVETRMDGRTEWTLDVDDGNCDGQGQPDSARGRFTKEYMAAALREGWADFIATWTWNKRTESNCTFYHGLTTDFDLDGNIDNGSGAFANLDDCQNTPHPAHDTGTIMDNRNWLDDLQDPSYANHCDREADDDEEANRSTVYDVSKLLWQLNHANGQGVAIESLTDMYVDMCPREWASTDAEAYDTGTYVDDDLPLERLKISADHHGLTTELNAVLPHVEH